MQYKFFVGDQGHITAISATHDVGDGQLLMDFPVDFEPEFVAAYQVFGGERDRVVYPDEQELYYPATYRLTGAELVRDEAVYAALVAAQSDADGI